MPGDTVGPVHDGHGPFAAGLLHKLREGRVLGGEGGEEVLRWVQPGHAVQRLVFSNVRCRVQRVAEHWRAVLPDLRKGEEQGEGVGGECGGACVGGGAEGERAVASGGVCESCPTGTFQNATGRSECSMNSKRSGKLRECPVVSLGSVGSVNSKWWGRLCSAFVLFYLGIFKLQLNITIIISIF